MTDFNYKKYSLEKLEEWMHDAMSCDETTPQDIFDVIKGVVKENYYHHKYHTGRAYELLALLNGNGQSYEDVMKEKEYYEPSMPPWGHSDLEYGVHNSFLSQDRNSNFPGENTICNNQDPSPECKGAWNSFWEENYYPEEYKGSTASSVKQDKVVKWVLPVQQKIEEGIDDYYVQFPDDLLEAANLKENDLVEWVDNLDGSYLLRKV
jgi:hypothetical protein